MICDKGWNRTFNSLLQAWIKKIIRWVDSSRWKQFKVTKNSNIRWLGYGLRILGWARNLVYWLPQERQTKWILQGEIGSSGKNKDKMSLNAKEKSSVTTKHCILSQFDENDGQIELPTLTCHLLYSPNLVPVITSCFHTLKKWSRKIFLAQMKKWLLKLKPILKVKTNCSTKQDRKIKGILD